MLRATVTFPRIEVTETHFRRLLGYPRGAQPSARAEELCQWARTWFAEHGRPWIYLREVPIAVSDNRLTIDGKSFQSPQLLAHLVETGSTHAIVFAVSAGRSGEEYARELWQDGKPDEYFFVETYGSAVVERLTALANAQVCAEAESRQLRAIPHYSPGYGTWDVAEQPALFALIQGQREPWPEPLDVLPSGMLRPKKSLLGVIGLSADPAARDRHGVPCERCSFSPCAYRRVPYRHDGRASAPAADGRREETDSDRRYSPLTRDATYSLAARALEKWSRERLQLQSHADGSVTASFRFDGTTCSNMGRPLAFEYRIELGSPASGYRVEATACAPAAGDDGYRSMCEYLRDPDSLMQAIATEKPLLGRPLDDVLAWRRESVSTGCHCDAASRAHKWGMAFEVVHFALSRQLAATAAEPASASTDTASLASSGSRH